MTTHPQTSEPPSDSPKLEVRASWLKATAWILIPAIGIGVALDILRNGFSHVSIELSSVQIFLSVAVAVAMFDATLFFFVVREVRLSDKHVEFVVGLRRVVVRWTDLDPPPSPLRISINFYYRREGVPQDNDGMVVTKAQARAILTYPACPRFELSRAILASLDFSSNPK